MIFNFSAGPSVLPKQVIHQIQSELYDWNGLGISVMEISHRSTEFMQLAYNVIQDFRELLDIPEDYLVLFCQGGARAQFSAIPMNLLSNIPSLENVEYINTGYWSYCAAMESKKYCDTNIIDVRFKENGLYNVQSINQWNISEKSVYVHYCPNETIDGIAIHEDPNFYNKTIVADCSSTLLSKPLQINRFGIIYAAAQKNLGISGLTVVILRKDLLKKNCSTIPSFLNYKILSDNFSMFNTPVTMAWYVSGLVFKWLKDQGGLKKIGQYNQEKSSLLYNYIDSSDFYYNWVYKSCRSHMNIPFFLRNQKLNKLFLKESMDFGLFGLKGHRTIGGIRASLYNAMPLEGVKKLVEFMHIFSKKYESLCS